MELFGQEDNPIPEGAVCGTVASSDGLKLRYAHWRPTGRRTLGTICLFQGRSECIEKYFETVSDLRRRGFAVATLDWRGQGGSDRRLRNRRKGHLDSFVEYDRDLDAFMEQVVLPDCPPPHYALAHSTGGLVCLRAARSRPRTLHADGSFVLRLLGLGVIRAVAADRLPRRRPSHGDRLRRARSPGVEGGRYPRPDDV